MLAAIWTKLLQAQALFHVLLILRCLIVALFTVGASHRNQGLIFRCHKLPLSLYVWLDSLTPNGLMLGLKSSKPLAGIGPATSSLPRRRSTTELQRRYEILSFEFSILNLNNSLQNLTLKTQNCKSARGRIRTAVLVRDQIYSLTPLTTRPPVPVFFKVRCDLSEKADGGIRTPGK